MRKISKKERIMSCLLKAKVGDTLSYKKFSAAKTGKILSIEEDGKAPEFSSFKTDNPLMPQYYFYYIAKNTIPYKIIKNK